MSRVNRNDSSRQRGRESGHEVDDGLRSLLRRHRRKLRYVLLVSTPLVAIGSWFVLQHKPGWYAPASLDEAGRQRARHEATERADEFGDRLVRKDVFEVVLLEEQVNEWLSVMPPLWETQKGVEVRDPAVHFEDGVVRFGALVDRSGWRVILSMGIAAALSPQHDEIELRLVDTYGGSFPIPKLALSWASRIRPNPSNGSSGEDSSSDSLDSLYQDIQSVDDLLGGVRRRNRFVWPNGERSFSIESLSIEPGRVRLLIRPE